MSTQIKTVKCTHVVAQVSVGFYDAEGNLISEALFPQVEGRAVPARLFYPHERALVALIDACIQQACHSLGATAQTQWQDQGTHGFLPSEVANEASGLELGSAEG